MTIGIGAASDSGTTVMMAADTKGSYDDPRYSDTLIGKQYDFFPIICSLQTLRARFLFANR